jgi:hypothetical protein
MAVKGLDLFREHFRAYADRYVLIGGTACDLVMTEAGLTFRATKDLDIVLCLEALDREFASAFWAFVRAGKYEIQAASTGKKRFYRFAKPADPAYPFMLELFARVPDALSVAEGSHLTPIPIEDEVSSLSAILLDDDYYAWIHSGRREVDRVPTVGPEHLVPLKARAWLDLRARKAAGEAIDSKAITKHKNDVFRLAQLIAAEPVVSLPGALAGDMRRFLDELVSEPVDVKALGIKSTSLSELLERLRETYDLG